MKDQSVSIALCLTALTALPAAAQFCVNSPQTYEDPGTPTSIAAADIDGDGDLDLITANRETDDLTLLINQGDATFTDGGRLALSPGDGPRWVNASDIDLDGDIDLIAANKFGNSITIKFNDGTGAFPEQMTAGVATAPRAVITQDIDADNNPDILVASFLSGNGWVTVFRNRGRDANQWLGIEESGRYEVQVGTRSIAAGDIDHDGDIDVVTADRDSLGVAVLFNEGDGTLGNRQFFWTSGGARDVEIADFDGDGWVDLAVADFHEDRLSFFANLGRSGDSWLGFAEPRFTLDAGYAPHGISLTDADLDGDPDIVLAGVGGQFGSLLINDGNANFAVTLFSVNANSLAEVVAADLDNDGDDDYAFPAVSSSPNLVSVVTNRVDPNIECIADFNRDSNVNTADIIRYLNVFNANEWCADLNRDGIINTRDFLLILNAFSEGCP